MKYAIAKIGGKQLKISEGETFKIEHQDEIKFEVLAYSDGKEIFFGTPFLEDITISATRVSEEKSKKIRVGRFKSKSRYRKTKGHRQMMSVVKIDEITKAGETKNTVVKAEKAPKTEKVEKVAVKKVVKKTVVKAPVKAAKTVPSTKVKKEKKAE